MVDPKLEMEEIKAFILILIFAFVVLGVTIPTLNYVSRSLVGQASLLCGNGVCDGNETLMICPADCECDSAADCLDDLFCTVNERCENHVCLKDSKICNDSKDYTLDSCNEDENTCIFDKQMPLISKFSPSLTTDLSSLEDLSNVNLFSVGVEGLGKLEFNHSVDLRGLDLDREIDFEDDLSVEIDIEDVSTFNKTTKITLYNFNLKNPKILNKDKTNCGGCKILGFDNDSQTVIFSVPNWNVKRYYLTGDSYCGDGTCDAEEECDICIDDCGECDKEKIILPGVYQINYNQFTEGYTRLLGIDEKIIFDLNGEREEYGEIMLVSASENSAELKIDKIIAAFGSNQEKQFDISSKDYNIKFFVKLNKVENNRATVSIKMISSAEKIQQPAASNIPIASCTDRIRNQGETGIDCGGPCAACYVEPVVQQPTPVVSVSEEGNGFFGYFLIGVIILFMLLGAGFVYYEKERAHQELEQEKQRGVIAEESINQLYSYIRQMLALGYTEDMIWRRLVIEGWKQETLNQIFMKMRFNK